ncbi:MAG TPA: YncE family protein [Gemmatimonadales bacterium]|nr:YncE family protein [Gemmatimonadales bacterium]
MKTRVAMPWLLIVALLAAACSTGPDLTPVPRSGQRMQFDGFSVLPPQGDGWYVAPTLPKDEVWRSVAGFVKQGSSDAGAAIWATAAVANIDTPFPTREQLLQQLLRSRETELRGGRFRLLEFRSAPGPTPGCHRYDAVAEDRAVPEFPGVVFVLSLRHALCLHPNAPTLAVNIAYSERRRQGQPAAKIEGEGEPFLTSLQFSPMLRPSVVANIKVQGDPQGIATDGRSVWVAELSNNSVARIDPETNLVAKRYAVGVRPVGLAVGEGAVWVATNGSDEVWTIDLRADEVRGPPIKVGREPLDIVVGPGSVWVTNMGSGTVSRIDPRTRQVVATIPVGAEPIGLALGASGVWVAGFRDSLLWRIDPRTNRILGAPVSVGQGPSAVIANASGVWVASQSATLSRVDEARNAVVTFAVGQSASGVVAVGQQIWVSDYIGGTVWRVDAASNNILGPAIPVGKGPVRLAVGNNGVWVSNVGSGTVSRVAGSTN